MAAEKVANSLNLPRENMRLNDVEEGKFFFITTSPPTEKRNIGRFLMKTVWTLVVIVALALPTIAQEKLDWQIMSRIRHEAMHNSQAMEVLHHLTDKIGPRLTNSPNMKIANEYTRDKLEEWGLTNAHLEAWGPFGLGWSFSRSVVQLKAPRETPLMALPQAWTPGTDGPVTGEVVLINIESKEDLEKYKGTLAGKVVFLDEPRKYEHQIESTFERYTDQKLHDMCHFEIPDETTSWGRSWYKRYKLRKMLTPFLREEGALAAISISSRDDGIIRVMGGGSYDVDGDVGVPSLIMAAEHYNMVARKLQEEEKVELTIDVTAQFHDEDLMAYNTIAEIKGTDLADEIVMAGAHLDSWHAATGALDNGVGVAMVMEAIRILAALDLKPRRTVRIGLWSGEEQGLQGSRAHVEKHFIDYVLPEGSEMPKDRISRYMMYRKAKVQAKGSYDKFSVYFNLDNGGGKIRGIYTQGNTAVAPIFEEWLKPFKDLGSGWVTNNDTGGTDHQSFDRVGLPGFQFIQDPLNYSPKNHHTHLDVYDHVIPADVKQAAAVLAGFIYQAATRDEKLPRKHMSNLVEKKDEKKKKKKKKKRKSRHASVN